jgi:beta-glucanase (GH16 family)
MKLSLFALIAIFGTAAAEPVPSAPEIAAKKYRLAFDDEFSGAVLDRSKWDYRVDSKAKSTQLPANVTLSNGILHLNLKKEPSRAKDYTGAGIISKPRFEYGYYEARVKVPNSAGWHTSFWMMNYDGSSTSPAQASQELDVLENNSGLNSGSYTCGVHKWVGKHQEWKKGIKNPGMSTAFHVYGCSFTPTTVSFYLDGELVHEVDVSAFKHDPQNIWLSSIGYTTIDDAGLPAEAEVDYVRFFQHSMPER